MNVNGKKEEILSAAEKAIDELIKVLKDPIIGNSDEGADLSADKMKNAAASKKLAFQDALEMLGIIEKERNQLNGVEVEEKEPQGGFAEKYSKGKKR
jgi:hypothetical protein